MTDSSEDTTVPPFITEVTELTTLRRIALMLKAHRARCAMLEGTRGEEAYPEIVQRMFKLLDDIEVAADSAVRKAKKR